MSSKVELRLALRAEGDWWNAYIAESGTMEGAHKVGSILMAAVHDNEERKEAFMKLMQSFMSDVLKDVTGVRPLWWEPKTAPERERAGNA